MAYYLMWRELNLGGIYFPPFLIYLAAAFLAYVPLRLLLGRIGFWRWTWNQPVAELCIYTGVLALVSGLL